MSVLWGIPYLLIRVAVRQLDPGVLVFARTGPVAILLVPLVASRRQLGLLARNAFWIITFGVIEFGIPWYLMATSERHITSSLTSLLICAVPMFSVLAQRLRRAGESVGPLRLTGLSVGAVGVALLVGLSIHGGSFEWIAMMLAVVLGYTVGPIILATRLTHVPGPVVVAGATAVVALGWLPWSIAHWPAAIDATTWWSIGVLSIFCTAGAFLTFFELVMEAGSTRSVVVTYVNTALAVVLGILLLNEPLTIGIVFGFPLVLIGSVLATSSRASGVELTGDAHRAVHH